MINIVQSLLFHQYPSINSSHPINNEICYTVQGLRSDAPPIVNKLHSNINKVCSNANSSSPLLSLKNCVDYLWHNKLGLVTFIKLRGISSITVTFAPKQHFLCIVCPMARWTKLPFFKDLQLPPKCLTCCR